MSSIVRGSDRPLLLDGKFDQPIAGLAELGARVTGREPFATREAIKLARKIMFFTSERATQELGYRPRPAREAIADAIAWFREHGYVR